MAPGAGKACLSPFASYRQWPFLLACWAILVGADDKTFAALPTVAKPKVAADNAAGERAAHRWQRDGCNRQESRSMRIYLGELTFSHAFDNVSDERRSANLWRSPLFHVELPLSQPGELKRLSQ